MSTNVTSTWAEFVIGASVKEAPPSCLTLWSTSHSSTANPASGVAVKVRLAPACCHDEVAGVSVPDCGGAGVTAYWACQFQRRVESTLMVKAG